MMRVLCLYTVILLGSCGWNANRAKQEYLAQGNALYEKGNYAEAELAYRKATQKDPKFAEAYFRLGLAQIKRGDFPRAVRSLQRAGQLDPAHTESQVALGDIFLSAYIGDGSRPKPILDQLLTIVSKLKTKSPDTYDTLRLSGYLALVQGNRQEALRFLRGANVAKPMQASLVLTICQNLMLENDGAAAEKLALQLMAAQKDYGDIYDFLYLYYRSAKRVPEAEAILDAKVANNPKVSGYRVQLAAHYASIGRGADTGTTLRTLTDRPADFPGARIDVGDYYLRTQNWTEAIRQYEEGLLLEPKNKLLYQTRIIHTLLFQQKIDEARKQLDTTLAENPKDEGLRVTKASLRLGTGDSKEVDLAVQEFQQLVKESPENAVLRFHLGRAWVMKRDFRSGQAELREAVKRRRDLLPAYIALTEVTIDMRQYREALQNANEILAQAPRNQRGRLLRAVALVGQENYLMARPELERLVQEYPEFGEAQLQYALLNLAEKRMPDAEAQLRRLYRPGHADPRVLRGMAEVHVMQGRLNEAIALVRDEIRKSPPPAIDHRRLLAELATRGGQFDLAVTTLHELIALDARPTDARFQLSGLYYLQGDMAKAIGLLEENRRQMPNDPTVLLTLGSLYERGGRLPEAQALYRETLKLDPDNAAAMNNLAYNLVESGGDLEEALVFAKRASQRAPNQPQYSDTMAWIYLKKKMTSAALQVFENLARKHPDVSTYRYHLGAALMEKGEHSRAKSELTAALTKKPSPHQESRIRALLASAN